VCQPPTDAADTAIVAARIAWPEYLRFGVNVAQPDGPFWAIVSGAVEYLGFHSKKQVYALSPADPRAAGDGLTQDRKLPWRMAANDILVADAAHKHFDELESDRLLKLGRGRYFVNLQCGHLSEAVNKILPAIA
jgi:hypothetical protein